MHARKRRYDYVCIPLSLTAKENMEYCEHDGQ